MCTIVALRDVHPDYPLVIAANRDEVYAREATVAQVLARGPRVVGGLDVASGGTWMGVTASGFFVGLTNQRTYRGPDPSLASRGPVVLEALALGETAAVHAMLERLDPGTVNSFNLLYGDARSLEVAYVRHESGTIDIAPVPPGVHVLPNDVIESPEFPKVVRARALVEPHAREPWPVLRDHLRAALADHQHPEEAAVIAPPEGSPLTRDFIARLHALCVHTDYYGTRSATLAALVPGAVAHYEFAAGPPCTSGFDDRTALVTGA